MHQSLFTQDGDTALSVAAKEGQGDIVELLLKCGASKDNQNKVTPCRYVYRRQAGVCVANCGGILVIVRIADTRLRSLNK